MVSDEEYTVNLEYKKYNIQKTIGWREGFLLYIFYFVYLYNYIGVWIWYKYTIQQKI